MVKFVEPLISIIVPVYNTELYLRRCIQSIIDQTYSNLEILLINDGSTDHSLDICNEFAKTDVRIKTFDKENKGVSHTRNMGLEKAIGEYIMFVDSDDFIDKHYVYDMYQELKNNHYEMIISGMSFCDEDERILKRELYKNKNQELKLDNIIEDVVNTLYFCSSCKTLVKRSLIVENDISFNEQLSFGEDLSFSYQLLKKSKSIGYLSNTGYYYRQNSTSLTHHVNIEKIRKYFKDNLVVFSQFNDSVLVANRVYTKLNITVRKIASINKIRYREFKTLVLDILNLYQKSNINKDINLDLIDYESKVNMMLLRCLKNNQLYRYYLIIKMINFIKNILRK